MVGMKRGGGGACVAAAPGGTGGVVCVCGGGSVWRWWLGAQPDSVDTPCWRFMTCSLAMMAGLMCLVGVLALTLG